jgi:hypothetical protein
MRRVVYPEYIDLHRFVKKESMHFEYKLYTPKFDKILSVEKVAKGPISELNLKKKWKLKVYLNWMSV